MIYGEPENLFRFEDLGIESPDLGIDLHTNVEVGDGHLVLIGKNSRRGENADVVIALEARLQDAWTESAGD